MHVIECLEICFNLYVQLSKSKHISSSKAELDKDEK